MLRLMMSEDRKPEKIGNSKRRCVKRRCAPASSYERRDADDDHHRHCDTRPHKAEKSECQSNPVALVDRAVVVSENELRETENERADERDQERIQDVVGTRPEEY